MKELFKLRATADYLFDRGVGRTLFPDGIQVVKSRGRIRQIWFGGKSLCSIHASNGFIVLTRKGDSRDRLLASGKSLLTGEEMIAFKIGKAVVVRRGFGGE